MQLNEFTTEQLDQLQHQLRKLQHDIKKEQQSRHDERYQPRYNWEIDPATFGMSQDVDTQGKAEHVEEEAELDSTPPSWEHISPEQEQQVWEQCQHERFQPAENQPTQAEQEQRRAQRRDGRNTNSQHCSQPATQQLPPSDWKMRDIKQDVYRILDVNNTQQVKRHVDCSDLNLRRKADWQTLWSRLQ